ncbi:hypothetical protein C8D87_106467 [Lentzea atacamensis]|uniref:Uncharacterized protein n=1 Tax=Lentzea atacamensis TaxID=531938 RepID=A0ABX9E6G3_9PSEU|nr:hypothetical protein [Lentzea atacamensis]RAS64061.1 hypothetical protein C8D87_106467 [Lentzea atacamensis]
MGLVVAADGLDGLAAFIDAGVAAAGSVSGAMTESPRSATSPANSQPEAVEVNESLRCRPYSSNVGAPG